MTGALCRRSSLVAVTVATAIMLPACEKKITDVPVEVTSVEVVAPKTTLSTGETVQLTATPRSADGDGLTARPVTWTSNNPAVAQVSGSGAVTGMGAGQAVISASSGSASGAVNLTVVIPARIVISLTPVDISALAGGTDPAPVVVNITNGGQVPLTGVTVGAIQYTSGAAGWLQVTPSGTSAPLSLTLTASIQGRAAGSYEAVVPITSSVANNSPQQLVVRLTIAPSFTLTVVGAGTGSGFVIGANINCTITSGTASGTCTGRFAANAVVNLFASLLGGGHTFATWGGACTTTALTCAVTMSADRTVTATFNAPTATLTITGTGSGNGTVTGTGGVNCAIVAGVATGTCVVSFPLNTSVTLTATAAAIPGHAFAGWSNACSGTSATCVVQMSAARTATASFNRIPAAPVVTTLAADSVASTTARINGRVTQDGSPYTVWFEFGTNATLPTYQMTSTGSGPTANCQGTTPCVWFTTLSQLLPGTTYYYRIAAQNAAGVTRGSILSFTTASTTPAPVIASLSSQTIAINSPTDCTNGGTYFRVSFGFADANGDVLFTGSPVSVAYVFQPSGSSGNITSGVESQTGSASSGTISFKLCATFATNASLSITVTLRDGAGQVSNPLTLVIPKPTGAINVVDDLAGARPSRPQLESLEAGLVERNVIVPLGTPRSAPLDSRAGGPLRK